MFYTSQEYNRIYIKRQTLHEIEDTLQDIEHKSQSIK